MYANRTHASRPAALTPMDRARQTAALYRAEREARRLVWRERINAVCTLALGAGVIIACGLRLM